MEKLGLWNLSSHGWCFIDAEELSGFRGTREQVESALVSFQKEYPDCKYEISEHQDHCTAIHYSNCCVSKSQRERDQEEFRKQFRPQIEKRNRLKAK
jgi:hypothetical protein